MKKTIFTSILSVFATFFTCVGLNAQTIRRCNNNLGVTGVNVYTSIQAAHDAAVDGDIIYVEPSIDSYGNLISTKRLTIIGNGYFLAKNTNVSFDTRSSKIGDITFNSGSANSLIESLDINYTINLNATNITVTRCRFGGIILGVHNTSGGTSIGNNAIITKNIFGRIFKQSYSFYYSTLGNNCIIMNNIGGTMTGGGSSIIESLGNSSITNNTFYLFDSNSSLGGLNNCIVSNNIFDARNTTNPIEFVIGISSNNTISNNICLGQSATPAGNGNINFGNATTTFLTSNPWISFDTEDSNFQLAVNSPAKAIGIGGADAGAFGGLNTYLLSGLPPVPITTNFTTTAAGNANVPIQVSVTVRSNN